MLSHSVRRRGSRWLRTTVRILMALLFLLKGDIELDDGAAGEDELLA